MLSHALIAVISQRLVKTADGRGMTAANEFDDSLLELMQAGIISSEEALSQASRRDNMLLKIRGVGA